MRENELSNLITDEDTMKILIAAFKKPRTAKELSRLYDIPIGACYRKIHALEKAGLMRRISRIMTRRGKRINIYQSQLEDAILFLDTGRVRLRFQLVPSTAHYLGGEWKVAEIIEDDK